MKKRDSFNAGMFATWGVLAALAIVGGGAYFVREEMKRDSIEQARAAVAAKDKADSAEARRFCLPYLTRNGITEVSDDAGVAMDGGNTVFVGSGRDSSGGLKRFMVTYQKARFGKKVVFKILSVNIDGTVVYQGK